MDKKIRLFVCRTNSNQHLTYVGSLGPIKIAAGAGFIDLMDLLREYVRGYLKLRYEFSHLLREDLDGDITFELNLVRKQLILKKNPNLGFVASRPSHLPTVQSGR